jgi:fructose-1,6-bisphosphatase/inositol monophosphatase family enzyme
MENKNFEKFAKDIALEAGKIIKDNFRIGIGKEWKDDDSPVTKVDLEVNKLIIDRVAKEFPEHSVLAEEGSNILDKSRFTWVCDPIDGTLPFSHGVPIFTFSLALVDDGVPILGIIYDPMLDRMFFASKGQGAYLNDKKISVSSLTDYSKAVFTVEFLGEELGVDAFQLMRKISDKNTKIFKFNSLIFSGGMVAAGEFMGLVFLKNTAHDAASIKIIVEEAGGRVTDIDGNEQRYDQDINGIIATNGLVHNDILEIIKGLKKG